jgi:hypothetical protein
MWPENRLDDPRTATGLLRLGEALDRSAGNLEGALSVPWWPFEVAPPSLIPPNFAGTPSYLFSTRSRSHLPSISRDTDRSSHQLNPSPNSTNSPTVIMAISPQMYAPMPTQARRRIANNNTQFQPGHHPVGLRSARAQRIPVANLPCRGFMQISKKIPFDDPNVLNGVRALYVISNIIIAGIYFYVQQKINAKNGAYSDTRLPASHANSSARHDCCQIR